MQDPKFYRRELISGSIAGARRRLESKFREMMGEPEDSILRPPGALPRDLFMMKCNACGKCVEACPEGAIRGMDKPGNENHGTPRIVPSEKHCAICDEEPACAKACPSGALIYFKSSESKIGTASPIEKNCLALQGTQCSYCIDYCPRKGTAIAAGERGLPIVDPEICSGCGACEYYCPAKPKAIYIRPFGL